MSSEKPKIAEKFNTSTINSGEPLLPPLKRNPWPILVPVILLIALVASGIWAFATYVAPQYASEEKAYEDILATAEEYEGETVEKKTSEPECFGLDFARENTIHTLCVSEELWNEQVEGKPFIIELLKEKPEAKVEIPWGN